ncbi:gamma carbonic anhydrase family protein [Paenibacillus xerothermodurans]|uniref:Gamma carbonic anhydrase family protein n=2 Tax=Paenibacillus xerothermodurans TaxID=1977292 RepID=A0A2W1NBA9_PAEXE|nr:gamma carbonic anhydrase family protein [Paenibacillus xerothermodurans]PZE21174.1 gamma carbonic anhydrase family protein [Paenibacillus xerothermodurans]
MLYSLGSLKPCLHPTAYVAPGAQLIGNITMEAASSVWFNSVLRGDNAAIHVGERSNIQDGCTLHVDTGVPLRIASRVTVGHNVILHGCTIHTGVLIGMGAIILNHAEIGEQSLIAAGALIPERKRIPPRVLVMGTPGKIVRELDEDDLRMLESVSKHYVEQSRRYKELIKPVV